MKISNATIDRLKPIIDKIDAELEKDQDERIPFQIYTERVNALKNALAHYKSLFRREQWNGRFWMTKKKDKAQGDYLDVSFQPHKKFELKIVEGKDGMNVSAEEKPAFVIQSSTPIPSDGPAREMTDSQASVFILSERPESAAFLRSYISEETNHWLDNMKTAEPTALINLLTRSGYRVAVVGDNRMRIYK